MAQLVNLSNALEFDTITGQQSCLVTFIAKWSDPCRRQSDILSNFITNHKHDLNVAIINVEEFSQIATKCNIQTLPTLLLYNKGKEVNRFVGLQDIPALNKLVECFNANVKAI